MASIKKPLSGYFITGSDTGVGKTWIGRQIITQLKHSVTSLKVRKPVESGCEIDSNQQLKPADGLQLFKANDSRESLQKVTPLRFKLAASPDRAARAEKQKIQLRQLYKAVTHNIQNNDTILVEGAGGFYSPIAEDGLNADLARLLSLPVIVVIEDRLGAINQSLLTIKAVEGEGLLVKAVVLNRLNARSDDGLDNLSDLKKLISYPVYYCKYNGELPKLTLA